MVEVLEHLQPEDTWTVIYLLEGREFFLATLDFIKIKIVTLLKKNAIFWKAWIIFLVWLYSNGFFF